MGRNPRWGSVGACQALERGQGLCLTWHRLAPAIPFSPPLGLAGGASPQFRIRTWPFPYSPLSYWVLVSLSLPATPPPTPLHTHLSWTQKEQDGVCFIFLESHRPTPQMLRHREVAPRACGGRTETLPGKEMLPQRWGDMRRCGWSRVGTLKAVGDKLKGS